jgi:hypothetical protein
MWMLLRFKKIEQEKAGEEKIESELIKIIFSFVATFKPKFIIPKIASSLRSS